MHYKIQLLFRKFYSSFAPVANNIIETFSFQPTQVWQMEIIATVVVWKYTLWVNGVQFAMILGK